MNMSKTFTAVVVAGLAAYCCLADSQPAKKMNILAFAAHPDDVELNVGGTLLKYKKAGHNIFLAYATSGNTGSNEMTDTKLIGETREKEALEAAKFYGAKVRFLRNDDERLLDTNETRTQVLDALRWAEPDIVFTHWMGDESPDHKMTSHLVRCMILSMPGINQQSNEKPCAKLPVLFMWDTGRGIGFQPEVYVDISDEFEEKLKALTCHKSQFPWMAVMGNSRFGETTRIRAAFYGMQYGCKYAEVFRGWRTSGYMPNFKLLP